MILFQKELISTANPSCHEQYVNWFEKYYQVDKTSIDVHEDLWNTSIMVSNNCLESDKKKIPNSFYIWS